MLIGEVARRSGVSARMLRHYDSLGLVRPSGRSGTGYREYSSEDIRRIFHVESLRSLGLSLQEVGRALDDPGFRPAELVDNLVRDTQERIERDTELLTRLRRVDVADTSDWDAVLRTVALLQDLTSVSAGKRQLAALSSSGEASDALAEAVLREPATNVAGALRWALAQSADGGLRVLREGLASSEPDVRRRAVETIVEIPGSDATGALLGGLNSPDSVVRSRAALALAERGVDDAIPVLVDMVAEGRGDVDAADGLAALSTGPDAAAQVTAALLGLMGTNVTVRRRVVQALADIPGPGATEALVRLADDEDTAVSGTAKYLLARRK